jgi:hypothetical protein
MGDGGCIRVGEPRGVSSMDSVMVYLLVLYNTKVTFSSHDFYTCIK